MSDIVVIVQRRPTADEYRIFREGAGWQPVNDSLADRVLANSVFCIVAEVGGKAVGMARVISDGGKYFYVHDVIVLPPFRRKGLATSLVKSVVEFFAHAAPARTDAVLCLVADPQVAMLYLRFGFQRDVEMASMFRLWRNRTAERRAALV